MTSPLTSPRTLLAEEYPATATTYLNTASHCLLPARRARALRHAASQAADGQFDSAAAFRDIEDSRAAFARLMGVAPGRVAIGGGASLHVALIAASLPDGAEVLFAEEEFVSTVSPFAHRPGLRPRAVPLAALADEIREDTALVAVSAVQSRDGRVADLAAIRDAARRHGARTMVDTSQAAGWLPLRAADFDFTVCAAYKWLLCPRGVAFLTVPEDGGGLAPLYAGMMAGRATDADLYGVLRDLPGDARRFDQSPAFLPYQAAARSLALLEELGPRAAGEHGLALADRFRAGLAGLGHRPATVRSPIVAVPGLGAAAGALAAAGIIVSARAGDLRVSFYLHNTEADVDRCLAALRDAGPRR